MQNVRIRNVRHTSVHLIFSRIEFPSAPELQNRDFRFVADVAPTALMVIGACGVDKEKELQFLSSHNPRLIYS